MTESAPAANNHSALLHGEAVFRVAFDEAPVGVIITDLNLRFMRVNREICRFLGFSAEELLALHVPDITHPDDLSKDLQQAQQLAAGLLDKFTMDKRYIRKDGQIVWGRLSARLVRDPAAQPLYLLAIIEDISQRMHAEEALHKLNRTLRALSKSSQAMLRAKDESAFVQEVCEIIVRDCGHRMAWVGYARHDEDQSVEPVAWAGAEDGYLQTVNITWADTERGRGPSGTAIRTGRAIISNNFATDPSFGPWRTAATQRGYASSIALPLLAEGHAFAALMIYSGQPAPFSAEEVRLLEELAEDLAYGITVLRLRAAHDRAEQALRASEQRFRHMADAMPQLVWTANPDGIPDYYNARADEYGIAATSLTPDDWTPAIHPDDLTPTLEAWRHALAHGLPYQQEQRLRVADGAYRWHLARAIPQRDEHGAIVKWFGTTTDIHDLKQADEAVIRNQRTFSELIERAPFGIYVIDSQFRVAHMNTNSQNGAFRNVRPVIGRDFAQAMRILWPEPVAAEIIAHFRHTLDTGEPYYSPRFINPRHDVEIVESYEWELHRMTLPDGQHGVICYYFDSTKLREAEAALTAANQRMEALMRAVPVGISFSDDPTCQHITGNPAVLAQFAVRAEDNLSASAPDPNAPGRQVRFYRDGRLITDAELPLQQAVAGNREIPPMELEVVLPDGRRWFTEASGAPIRDAQGNIIGGIAVTVDITQRKRAEEALRQSHEQMKRVLEVETVGVMFWDLNTGCLIDANDTFLKMMGYTRGDVEAHDLTWQKFTPPEFHEVSRAEVAKFMATGRVGPYEKEYFRKDGSRQWLLFAGSSLGNNQCVEFCVDIGQLKQTEDALRFLAQCANAPGRDFFQELARYLAETLAMDFVCIDSLHDGLLVAQTLAMYFDGKFDPNVSYTLQDTPCGDVVGKSICCFPHGVRHRFPKDEVLQNMLAESYVGTTLWNAQGQPIGLIAVIGRKPLLDTRLATSILQLVAVRAAGELERRQAEEALAAAKAAAEAANQAKDHFLAALSHELRTPLSPALMLVTTHENNPEVPDPVRLDLATVRHNIELEVRIIDDLLDLSRVTSGKMRMHPQNVSVREVLRQAIGTCAADITGRNLQLHQEFTATHDLVHADPARLQQVFWNLLKNAVKFTPTGGRLKVTCQNVNMDRVQVRVQDSGIGIPPDSLARIFEAFEQADKNITRQFGGLGLGLAISKAIVDLHGGSIRAESAGQGQGATFTVELPITHTAPPPQRTAASSTPADAPRQLRLLLVEDHADTARTLARLLRASGHHVQTADSLAAARTLLAQERFDLLLSDLGLPDGTGYDLMQHAKAAYAIPGICMSGFGMETDIERSRQAGFAAHLTKPIHIQQLEQTIHQVASRLAPPISPPPQEPRA